MRGTGYIHTEMEAKTLSFGSQGTAEVEISGNLAADTMTGLNSYPKFLLPKYFYDDKGSSIFRRIMSMPEYYLTRCEHEIFSEYAEDMVNLLIEGSAEINLIEPGAGDGSKTIILLKGLVKTGRKFRFIPVDINNEAIIILRDSVLSALPDADVQPRTGDYFHMFDTSGYEKDSRNVILFLGSNIGNLNNSELNMFLENISGFTKKGDKMLIGFDLKKSPGVIMKAYDDAAGLTRQFNLNHLVRLNRELEADFNLSSFEHHTEYNPVTGELKSYLISTVRQTVYIGALDETFTFGQWEPVFMELSRKFDTGTIGTLAISHGFRVVKNFTDSRSWFVDSIWTRV